MLSAPLKVLIVEDEPLVRFTVAELFEDFGAVVVLASNADAGLEVWEANPDIGLVFTDVKMPGVRDGLDLARLLRQRAPDLPIVLASAHLHEAEGFEFVAKPYRGQDIERLLLRFRVQTAGAGQR